MIAALTTSAPLAIQLIGVLAVGFIGLALLAAIVGLALGAIPNRLAGLGTLPDRDAVQLGVAAGLFGAAVVGIASWLRTPAWAQLPNLAPLGTVVPVLAAAIDPVTGFLTRLAVMTATLLFIERITCSWTQQRAAGLLTLGVIGFLVGRRAGERADGRLGAGGRPYGRGAGGARMRRCCGSTSRSSRSRSAR